MIKSGVIYKFKQISVEFHATRTQEFAFLKMCKISNLLQQIDFVNVMFYEFPLYIPKIDREWVGNLLLLNKKYVGSDQLINRALEVQVASLVNLFFCSLSSLCLFAYQRGI